jgi:methionine-rich copper-binding protein CopC
MMVMAAIAVILVGTIVRMPSGSAHAEVERSSPAADEVLQTAPTMVEIFFSQEIDASGTVIRVLDASGTQVDLGDTTLDLNDPNRKHVTVSLPADLAPGIYTVEWTSASAEDEESTNGSFSFTIAGSAAPGASPVASPMASPVASPVSATPSALY